MADLESGLAGGESEGLLAMGQAMVLNKLGNGAVDRFKDEANRLQEWVQHGDKNLNMLCFLGGAMTTFISFFGMLNILNPLGLLLSVYNVVFGVVIMLLELRQHLGNTFLTRKPLEYIDTYAKVLSISTGRGIFYVYVGSLMVANAGGVIKLFVGIYMCTVGIMSVLVSLKTVKEISVLEEKIQQAETVELELTGINPRKSPEFITKQFGLYDSNGDGFITQSELQHLCKSLGSPLDEQELKHALQILDPSNTQAIEAQDFVAWFGGQDISFV